MLIECPSCHARAQIPSSKEGAKVRCGECGRVYVARAPGARARARSGNNTGLLIGIGGAIAAVLVVLILYQAFGGEEPETARAAAPRAAETPPEPVDELGWDAPTVQTAVGIHEAAALQAPERLGKLLYGPRIYALEGERARAEDPAAPERTADQYRLLPANEQAQHIQRWAADFIEGAGKELVADWRPYEGSVVAISDDEATVRLAVLPREGAGVEKRWMQWQLYLDGIQWKAYAWERWFSPEELAAIERANRPRAVERVTLSDGSKVLERQPEPLEHEAETPPELRKEIDELYATMVDLDLTKESSRALARLVEIGRPSIPILLTGLYETPLDSQENAIRCNLIDQALRQITGQAFGFKPQIAEGSAVGTTDERRQSAVKQWFAWWYRNKHKFQEKEVTDGLEGMIELTDQEKKWLERHKDD